ncbi:protein mono-ADP-ribosyltransferase PARP12-like isoform X3 [Ranitomeya imitator]|uniref:protein mono-ADP-ribosyltransferase PARP12-like isoform X3 n=1 Tax=Ranitomeya imitator TaxID=111125 RepID=UPI0037E83FF2
MSDPTVTAFLTKLLCSQGGRIPRDQLSGFLKLPPEQIEQILRDEPQKFSLVGDLVLARNPVRICPKYLKDETEEECDKLHLCRYYLQGKCKSLQCKFSHDILSSHNQSTLKAQGVSGLNEDELKVLLYQNDNQMLPEICVKYLHDTCDLGQACSRLHVCGFFTRGECNRRQCIRSHHLLESSADLLLARSRMSQVSVQNFQMLCTVKHNERFQSLSESGKKSEEKGNPAARRGRGKGRGRHRNNKKGDSQNETRSKSRGRQGDRAGSNFRGRSSSRAMSENGERYLSWSGDDDEEAAPAKSQADKIMEDWFSPTPARSDDGGASLLHTGVRASPIIPPLMSIGIHHPTSTVTTISPPAPQVSSQPGVPAGLLTLASTTSVPQLKPAITPVTTTHPFNTPRKPVNLPNKVESDKVPEICIPHLWKYCRLGGRCPEMHYYLPYRWQINKGTDWEDVPNMEEVEKCYCDPKVDRVPLIDFLTMRSGGHHVRRLSTVSSVVKPSEYVLTTEWLWYWRDEYGSWIQYGQSNMKQVSSNILSSDLENVYLPDPVAVIPFTAGNQKYEIDFRVMKQKNIQYKTEKDVRRRPKFLSFEDVKLLRGSTRSAAAKSPLKSGTSPMSTDIYPKSWDPEAMPEIGCKKVLVSNTSSEFSEIVSSFFKTVSGHEVKRMWRLQNPTLWQVFQWQKEQMKKVNPGRDVKEIRSFHGTERTHIETICSQNFDWRICGTHGTVYGQGSYFARDASYSHNYSTPTSSGTRAMFVARVLVGDYVTGNPQMKRPPLRPGSSSQYYDSCVDNIFSPSIFVVFEKHQIYPEYLLEYEEEQKKSCIVC